jgi:probable F420-dependent oxidoreductase
MKFTVQYPIAAQGYDPALLSPEGMIDGVRAAEAAGFEGVAFTDHPAPSDKWLKSGGHDSFDPLTALAFCAAATSRIRLQTYLLVLPYRNPLLAAKQIATVDVLSGGRLIVAMGTGYLRSEFAALGVEFEERGELFDEAVSAMTGVWGSDDFQFEGRHFRAQGQTARPRPAQQPHPPLWVGGNSRAARRRVARYGQGWSPLMIGEVMSRTIRTPQMATAQDLKAAVADLRELTEAEGRDFASLDVQVEGPVSSMLSGSPAKIQDEIATLADAGATWMVVDPPGGSLDQLIERLQWYGENVIRPLCRSKHDGAS